MCASMKCDVPRQCREIFSLASRKKGFVRFLVASNVHSTYFHVGLYIALFFPNYAGRKQKMVWRRRPYGERRTDRFTYMRRTVL